MAALRIRTDLANLETENGYKAQDGTSPDSHTGSGSDLDSLFDEPLEHSNDDLNWEEVDSLPSKASYVEPPHPTNVKSASRLAPTIQGLYFTPHILLPEELAENLLQTCIDTYFYNKDVNQVMLFERVITPHGATHVAENGRSTEVSCTRLPSFLTDLLSTLSQCMRGFLPLKTHELLFPPSDSPPQARQVIINMYRPGEGITPHVDLLDRFGDGIIGVSLGSGCVMNFAKVRADSEDDHRKASLGADEEDGAVFLPHGSVYVMSEEARYGWTHGIDGRTEDWVQDHNDCERGHWVVRSIRVSITFRWLLPGADIVGGLPDATSTY